MLAIVGPGWFFNGVRGLMQARWVRAGPSTAARHDVSQPSFWRDPVLGVTVGLAALLALPVVLPLLPPGTRAVYSETCTTLPFLLLAVAMSSRSRNRAQDGERRFWYWMTAALVCWLGQQGVLIATYTQPPSVSLGLATDLLYTGLYLFVVLALDTRPHVRRTFNERSALAALRRGGIVTFVFGALVYLVLVPAAFDPGSYWAGTPSFTFYILLDAYLVIRVALARGEANERRWRQTYGWLLATVLAWLILDTIEALMWTEVLPWIPPGGPWDLPWMVPLIALVMVARSGTLAAGEGEAVARVTPSSPLSPWDAPSGTLILLAIITPLLHFSVYTLELFNASTRQPHELVTFGLLVVLGSLVFAYQRTLEARNRRLDRERCEALARIEHQAYHDPLTALPNRRLLEDRMAQAAARAERRSERLAILFIDLDDFKRVNDSSGHAVGDEVLRGIGRRLSSQLRATDTLARVGGDEFVVMATDIDTREAAGRLAAKIRSALEDPFEVNGAMHTVNASIGIGLYPDDGDDFLSLLHHADAAMYQAKAYRAQAMSTREHH